MSSARQITQYTTANTGHLLRGGEEYFTLLRELIDGAKACIFMQVYIMDEDETGRTIARALMDAARRGVSVYVLADGYASQHLSRRFIREVREAGVNLKFFNPLFKGAGFYFGRRLHCKAIVVDEYKCMVAGVNISNRYNDIDDIPAWLDWAVYAEGEVARQLQLVCRRRWNRSVFRKRFKPGKVPHPPLPPDGMRMRILQNDWANGKTQITHCYLEILRSARKEVVIVSSYFWPSARVLKQLARATKRGVRVRLVLAGISDVKTSKYAERYLYRFLFRNKVEIYEYTRNVLHGKMGICDDRFMTIGSYNVNNISAFASLELNMEIRDVAFAVAASKQVQDVIDNYCEQITQEGFTKRYGPWQRLLQYLAYRAVHLIFFLTTFYFRQSPDKL